MHCKLFFSEHFSNTGNFILFYFIFSKITEKKFFQFFKKFFWSKLAKMPKYSPQQKTLLGTHSSEIWLNEWNFVHIRGRPIPGSILVAGPSARSGSHLKGLPSSCMVQFRFWSAHFRTTDGPGDGGLFGSVQLAESVLNKPTLRC